MRFSGVLQFADVIKNGYWHARSLEFSGHGAMTSLAWLRLPVILFLYFRVYYPLFTRSFQPGSLHVNREISIRYGPSSFHLQRKKMAITRTPPGQSERYFWNCLKFLQNKFLTINYFCRNERKILKRNILSLPCRKCRARLV